MPVTRKIAASSTCTIQSAVSMRSPRSPVAQERPRRLGEPSSRGLRDSRGRGSAHSVAGRFDQDELAAAEELRDRACPLDLAVRVALRLFDRLDLDWTGVWGVHRLVSVR